MDNTNNNKQNEEKTDPYSYHIFLFPFKWEALANIDKNDSFENRMAVSQFESVLGAKNWNGDTDKKNEVGWYRRRYSMRSIVEYNEYNYFYDFVREVMYDLDENLQSPNNNSGDILHHFEYYIPKELQAKYSIEIQVWNSQKKKHEKVPYELDLEDIILNVYNTGVGVLSFHLANRKVEQSAPKHILRINQFGRRIFPPFFGLDKNKIGRSFEDSTDWATALERTQKAELAVNIKINWHGAKQNKLPDLTEDFEQFTEKPEYTPFQLPKFILNLFPHPEHLTTVEKQIGGLNDAAKLFISPVLDDRMFVISWYGNNKVANRLSHQLSNSYAYQQDDWWYKYIFVDNNIKTCQNDILSIELVKKHSYARWINYETLYGVSRYSLVCVTPDLDYLRKDHINAAFLLQHIQSIYYKLTELVLIQRASLLRFSDEITHVSTLEKDMKFLQKGNDLYKNYIRFVNKIYFREVTAQEQGIEIYNLIQKHMMIERDVKDLDREMEELSNYARMIEEKERLKIEEKRNDKLELLTIMGAVFLVPTFITGFYGMNMFNDQIEPFDTNFFRCFILSLVFIIGSIIFIFQSKWNTTPYKLLKGLAGLGSFVLLVNLMIYPCDRERQNPEQKFQIETTTRFSKNLPITIDTTNNTISIPLDSIQLIQTGKIVDKKDKK